jgi:superfamily II DNA/RNA helicase
MSDEEAASLSQLKLHLDPGLIHERVIAPNNTRLLCLSRLLRKELQEYSQLSNTSTNITDTADNGTELLRRKKISSPRVVIFFPNEEEARGCMPKLRDAMWGDYKLCVLLPNTGVSPLTVMEDFKLNKTSVMLATANSVRGLDFEG